MMEKGDELLPGCPSVCFSVVFLFPYLHKDYVIPHAARHTKLVVFNTETWFYRALDHSSCQKASTHECNVFINLPPARSRVVKRVENENLHVDGACPCGFAQKRVAKSCRSSALVRGHSVFVDSSTITFCTITG